MIGNTEKIYPLWGNLGLLVLRLFVAYLVIKSGYGKLFTEGRIEGFSGYLTSLGVPFPLISAYLAALTEFFASTKFHRRSGEKVSEWPGVLSPLAQMQELAAELDPFVHSAPISACENGSQWREAQSL